MATHSKQFSPAVQGITPRIVVRGAADAIAFYQKAFGIDGLQESS